MFRIHFCPAGSTQNRTVLTDRLMTSPDNQENPAMKSRTSRSRRILAVALMLATVSGQMLPNSPALAQSQAIQPTAVRGELSLTGAVTINGVRAMPGDTVLNDTVLKTECKGTAAVNLGQPGRIELGPGSEMVMALAGDAIGGTLRAGSVTISAPAGTAVSIITPSGVVTTSGQDVSVLTVDLSLGNTRVTSKRSDVKIAADNKVEYISAGQETAVGTQNPGQGTRCARLAGAGGAGGAGGAAGVPVGLSGPALAALIVAGVGGAVASVVAASQSDSLAANQIVVSTFIP